MSNIILLFLCLFLGFLLKKTKLFPENGHVALNSFVINISLSALSLYYIPKINLNFQVIFPVMVPWLNIILAVLFFSFLGKKLNWSKTLIGALIMGAGFGNTSFVGIPVIQSLYGESGLKTVMLVDQPGSFVALSTLGITIASFYSGEKTGVAQIIRKIIKFPPFIAFAIAVILNIINITIPVQIDEVFAKLGATTVPLALVSVGSQLKWHKLDHDAKPLLYGLLFKLILFPAIIFILYFMLLNQRGEMIEIAFFESAMGPMVTATIIAAAHRLEPKLCNLMIGVGIPLSFITLTFWYLLLKYSGLLVM
ncbi:AEC family transporter [Chryseobacterium sp. SNU WT5]|uniref:AEC family transporter n=1 Tax=Chryseobacterium sp. SNU WT5 TaxID=2594269 RepID=UPI00117E6FBE|nr:AEC family transporter [Chryseobacterium sp. SNU WT5]QDP84370.1 AEC family transporter [Chryseobacterium sp. SNU WT5]